MDLSDLSEAEDVVIETGGAMGLPLEDYYTLPETNIAPENGWLEDDFPFKMAYFQGLS